MRRSRRRLRAPSTVWSAFLHGSGAAASSARAAEHGPLDLRRACSEVLRGPHPDHERTGAAARTRQVQRDRSGRPRGAARLGHSRSVDDGPAGGAGQPHRRRPGARVPGRGLLRDRRAYDAGPPASAGSRRAIPACEPAARRACGRAGNRSVSSGATLSGGRSSPRPLRMPPRAAGDEERLRPLPSARRGHAESGAARSGALNRTSCSSSGSRGARTYRRLRIFRDALPAGGYLRSQRHFRFRAVDRRTR